MTWNPQDYDSEWPFESQSTKFVLDAASTALLIIDLQPTQFILSPASPLSQHPNIVTYWNERIEKCVFPNTRRLIDHFREHKEKVVYTRKGYITSTGQEAAPRLRPKQPVTDGYRGTPAYEIDDRITPQQDEIVVDCLTSGSFTCSWLDHALRNMGIKYLVITGVASDMCVMGTARTAAELGYYTLICEDACAAYTQRIHTEAMLMHARKFGRVAQCQDIIAELEQSREKH